MFLVKYWKEGKKYKMKVTADHELEARCKVFSKYYGRVKGFTIISCDKL